MSDRPSRRQVIVAAALLSLTWLLFLLLINTLPIATTGLGMDWPGLWRGLRGGVINYGSGLRNPPWSLVPLLLLGLMPLTASWAGLIVLTLCTEILSVPSRLTKSKRLLAAFFIATSYPSVRNIADGNLELLVIGGALLIMHGLGHSNWLLLSGGILLASAKPQASWLLLLFVLLQIIRSWQPEQVLKTTLAVVAAVSFSMAFYGADWFNELVGIPHRGTLVDMSLISSLGRLGVPSLLIASMWFGLMAATLFFIRTEGWGFSRLKAGLLLATSLMLAPYAAGNSLLSVAAIGILPLFMDRVKVAMLLAFFLNLPYLFIFRGDLRFEYGAYYGLGFLILFWITTGLMIRLRRQPEELQIGY